MHFNKHHFTCGLISLYFFLLRITDESYNVVYGLFHCQKNPGNHQQFWSCGVWLFQCFLIWFVSSGNILFIRRTVLIYISAFTNYETALGSSNFDSLKANADLGYWFTLKRKTFKSTILILNSHMAMSQGTATKGLKLRYLQTGSM